MSVVNGFVRRYNEFKLYNPLNTNNMQLEHKAVSLLLRRRKTLAVAESCTGGLLSHTLTNIPGSSAVFLAGIVAYDNAAKVKILKVPAPLIKKHGAVSAAVAQKMAQGARRLLTTDLGIGITGIAGPGGGAPNKPVGLTYIALSHGTTTCVYEYRFKGGRLANKRGAVRKALELLKSVLA